MCAAYMQVVEFGDMEIIYTSWRLGEFTGSIALVLYSRGAGPVARALSSLYLTSEFYKDFSQQLILLVFIARHI